MDWKIHEARDDFCLFFYPDERMNKLRSIQKIPEAGGDEHRVVVVKGDCLEHMVCLRLVLRGWPYCRMWGNTGLGCYRLLGWVFRTI